LRDATQASIATPATNVARQAAFIKSNGSIVGLDGTNFPIFDISISNDLYLVLWQKNHLGIMSSTALNEFSNVYSYNFTSSATQAYDGPSSQNEVNTNIWAMISGDANKDGDVTLLDYTVTWVSSTGEGGYLPSDHNLDGHVNNKDKNDHWLPNIGKSVLVPQ